MQFNFLSTRTIIWKINPNDFRGIVRCVVYLRRSFENLLQKIKKDQFHNGLLSVIAAQDSNTCPVKLIHLYFSRFKLVFASELSTDPTSISGYREAAASGKRFRERDSA